MLLLALGGACAHNPKPTDVEGLKPVVEDFHKRVRWKDYRYVLQYVVPERRKELATSIEEHHDEQDLDVTEFDLESVEFRDEGQRALVTSSIRWTHLPSVSVKKATVTSEFIYRNGLWLLEKQHGGPFDGALP